MMLVSDFEWWAGEKVAPVFLCYNKNNGNFAAVFRNFHVVSENPLLAKLERCVTKCMMDYALVENGDSVLIGLSGGKDSLALTELLARRSRIFAPKFGLKALYVDMEGVGYESDTEYLKGFCNGLGIEFNVRRCKVDFSGDKRKSPCFLCSWYRRKVLFDFAKESGCNKIALGHHRDDIIATLLMNMTFQGSFSTMPPLLRMNKFDMCIIRPLALIDESDLDSLAAMRGYRIQKKRCPYERSGYRKDMQGVVERLSEMNGNARSNIWRAMENIQRDYLPVRLGTDL